MAYYYKTLKRDAFTRDEIREWKVERFKRWKSSRGGSLPDGYVPVHSMFKYYPDNCTAYKYHQTEIVRYGSNQLTLSNGGYITPTTKKNICRALKDLDINDIGISTHKGDWYIHWYGVMFHMKHNSIDLPLDDPAGYLTQYMPYGTLELRGNRLLLRVEGVTVDYNETITKLRKLPEDPTTLILKAKYGVIGEL